MDPASPDDLPIGLVGPQATNAGLGPHFATHLLRQGARVVAVASSTPERARLGAGELAARLGQPVAACASVAELCARPLRGLVIASPPQHHLAALRAAGDAGLPTLCEKPLVAEAQADAGARVVAAFADAGLLLLENCQWPYVLPALAALHGPGPAGPARRVALGLGPRRIGRWMFADSLSHLLSLAQAVAPLPSDCQVRRVVLQDPAMTGAGNQLTLTLGPVADGGELLAELHVRQCVAPPRPAWVEVDGRRMDRRIGPDYAFTFVGNGRAVPVPDPMAALVGRFVGLLRTPDAAARSAANAAIALRLRLYQAVMAALPTGPA